MYPSLRNSFLYLGFMISIAMLSISTASAKTIMVFAPHPDDEMLMTAGIIRKGIQNQDIVKVVVVTNGDYNGVGDGYGRQRETVSALNLLGLSDQDIIFLGYGDASLTALYNAASETNIVTSNAGQTKTYGDQGLGGKDYHSFLYGIQGDYNKQTLFSDIQAVITNYSPDEIYVTSLYDSHADHRTTYLFVVESIVKLKRLGQNVSPLVREVLIHEPCEYCNGDYHWPMPSFTPSELFLKPPFLDLTPLRWNEAESVIVPIEMQNPNEADNLKYQAISKYMSQATLWLFSFVKKDEFFWEKDFKNIALTATVTVSSENSSTGQLGKSAVDGVIDGYPGDFKKEWASIGQSQGIWITLRWDQAQEVSQIRLYDRPNLNDNILSGTLIFSDGSTLQVGPLSNNGSGYTLAFSPKSVTSVSFQVDSAKGNNVGLAEIEIYGVASKAPSNALPVITAGPTASPSSINDVQASNLSITASDADGDLLSYLWTTTGGSIIGSGSNVSFYPPLIDQNEVFHVTVVVSDGRGGSTSAEVLIPVVPSGAANVAAISTVSVSSESGSTGQLGIKAIDGNVDGYPGDFTKEWATAGQLGGAWITLRWAKVQEIFQVRLYDRPNLSDHILTGTLIFSDGSTVPVDNIPNAGVKTISFENKFVTSVTFRVDSAVGSNIGLSEIQVFGSSNNAAPQVTSGPTAAPSSINDIQSASLSVQASDADNDPLTYLWTTNGGSITANGPDAIFYPPRINVETVFTVVVTVSDGQGGSVRRQTLVTVAPSFVSNVAPNALVSVSSENLSTEQIGIKAIDGTADGYPGDYTKEWATIGQTVGASITLNWSTIQEISAVKLFDRPNLNENILTGTLIFSDGSTVPIGSLPNNGTGLTITFGTKFVNSVTFVVDVANGTNIGLAEFEVYGR